MNINSVSFNPEIASIYQSQTLTQPLTETESGTSDKDSYIPSQMSGVDAIPSGTYNASGRIVGEAEESQTSEEGGSASGAGVGGAGGSGGSGSSEETSTTVVTINGQTYLETTTTDENGNTTTTRTLIGSAQTDEEGNTIAAGPSPAAQALASL